MGSVGQLRQPGPLGQVPFESYTIILLGFRLENNRRAAASAALDEASLKLAGAFPWLAAQVVVEGRTATKSGKYAIVPYPDQDRQSLVRKKDCTDLCPDYDDIVAAKAPFSMLDAEVLCPISPMGYNMSTDVPWPMLVIFANFINNGLLLGFATQHNGADMTGQGRIITYFAQALRGEPFNPEDVLEGNRTPDIPLFPPDEEFTPPARLIRPSTLHINYPTPPPPADLAPWTLWRLSSANANKLKTLTNAYSTNDAIAALYVQRLTDSRVTAGRIPEDSTVVIDRAMNIRQQCGYPERYLGSAAGDAVTTIHPFQSLATTAASLRKSLNETDTNYARRFATLVERAEDRTTIFYGAKTRPGIDIVLSSWAKLPLATIDFGDILGGLPGFVRRPRFGPAPELCYILPRTKDGDWEVAPSLSPADAELLKKDGEWLKWMEHIE